MERVYKEGIYERVIKRIWDVILCSIALVVLSPVFLVVAIGIKLSSPGPVLYRSERAGRGKKFFDFYKFRSMHVTDSKKSTYVADQARLFPFGKLIRRLKLDELPQLLNVIKGDMSIVGSRPMTKGTVEWFYGGRYEPVSWIRPGLTSAASLYDYTVGDTYEDNEAYEKEVVPIKREMELIYFEKQSFSYDVNLVVRTIGTIIQVIFGKKSFKDQPELSIARERLQFASEGQNK